MSPPSPCSLSKGLRTYLVNKSYNEDFGDLAPQILCNSLNVQLNIIIEISRDTFRVISNEPWNRASDKMYIHRPGQHYNGIVETATPRDLKIISTTSDVASKPSGSECSDPQSTNQPVARQVSYSRSELLYIGSLCSMLVSRHVRKALFRNYIWKRKCHSVHPCGTWTGPTITDPVSSAVPLCDPVSCAPSIDPDPSTIQLSDADTYGPETGSNPSTAPLCDAGSDSPVSTPGQVWPSPSFIQRSDLDDNNRSVTNKSRIDIVLLRSTLQPPARPREKRTLTRI